MPPESYRRRFDLVCRLNKPLHYKRDGVWWVMDRNGREWIDV